jgi:hypothetical protein
MISVILYGRNDAHGYNLHRRAALSLNCIAEVLSDPDDEIVFVDYNTPDELPTFIEAISDTLTDRCLGLLRVLRVPEAIHEQRFAAHTHLPVVEPVARNVAARRANPANRWVLCTNTDMIFVPLVDQDLSEICSNLPDGFYGLPRFELPEWLWERLPRSDPHRAAAEIERLGPALKLDEATVSHEWIRFDAPGDFQLALREDFAAIDGCNEEMLLGYHVDSNLSRRLLLHRGSIESLEDQLAGYHCNHSRTRTVYHGSQVANDLAKFFFSVEAPEVHAQRATWGLADVPLEEVPIRERAGTHSAAALIEAIPTGQRTPSDAFAAPFAHAYDSGHVLPFVADTLIVSPPGTTIGYAGANAVLEPMLARLVDGLGFESPLAVARLDDITTIDELARVADVFVFDLGVDVSQVKDSLHTVRTSELPQFPVGLDQPFTALDRLIDLERARITQGEHPRRFVLVNSSMALWDAYVLAQFECSYTTIHSRVRRATVKADPDDIATRTALTWARRLMRWSTRREIGEAGVLVRPGETVDIADVYDYGGFGEGWADPDETGIWTQGVRSVLRLTVDEIKGSESVLTFIIATICTGSDESLRVELLADGERVAAREFTDSAGQPWRVDLPSRVWAGGKADLTLRAEQPRSFPLGSSPDGRRLGMLLHSVNLQELDRSVRLGESVAFSEGSGSERLLGEGWSTLEPTGVWTVEERAELVLDLADIAPSEAELVIDVTAFVTPDHPELQFEVAARKQRLATRALHYGDADQTLQIDLDDAVVDEHGRLVLELLMRDPMRPVELGLGSDPRRLGVHLRSLAIRTRRTAVSGERPVDTPRRLRSRMTRYLRA